MSAIYFMPWDELERGWGRRPDGCSLHSTPEACSEFIKDYWARQPKEVPDEYESPALTQPKALECEPGLAALVQSLESLRLWKSDYRATEQRIEALGPELLAKCAAALARFEGAELDQATPAAPARPKPTL